MTNRLNVMSPRRWATSDGEEKTYWHKVGTAFVSEKGIGITFDSLPLPDKDGKTSVRLFEPRQKDGNPAPQEAERRGAGPSQKPPRDEIDDDIPF